MSEDGATLGLEEVLERFAVGPEATVREVLALIDANGEGVAIVLDAERHLLGIITDGDIRRAILDKLDFEHSVGRFLEQKRRRGWEVPLAMPADTPSDQIGRLMKVRLVRHMPLVDEQERVCGLALERRFAGAADLPMRAVVMAGGFGTRLRPLTENVPKPLLKVSGKPVIEHIVGQLRESGVRHVNITTHYHADKIREHFGDGSGFGVDVRYTHEEEPLGTAGALSMVEATDEPLLVINGDVLTAVDFRAMLAFHQEHQAKLTVGVRKYEVSVPYGVVEGDGERVTHLTEKPSLEFFINAGIYLLEPSVLRGIEAGQRSDMTDVIQRLLDAGENVTSFPIHEYWIDIGQMDDYLRASSDDLKKGKEPT